MWYVPVSSQRWGYWWSCCLPVHLTQCQRHNSKQISEVFSSDRGQSHEKTFTLKNSGGLCVKPETFSVKLKSLLGQHIPGSQAAYTSASLAWGHHLPACMIVCQISLWPTPPALPSPHRSQVRLKGSRQWPLFLSWHRKFIAVQRHTNQILQEQGGQGLAHSGDTFFTRTGAKNQLLLACCPCFFKYQQSQTSWFSLHSPPS